MREMKDSGIEWIGQIPTGWELRRAKTLFMQRNSKGNEIEVLLSPTQKYGVVPQSQLEGVVQVKEDTDLQMFKTVHKGDFVISLRSFQGGFEYSLYEGVCSPAYQVFYPTSPICDTYYRYLFKSQSFISKMNNLTVGIREGKNIQYVDFANSQIPVPPLAEQERIAAFLDAECAEIDAVLEKTRASIEEYKKLKQAVITQAVTKGIRGDRPMKDSGIEWIGDIPAEWDVVRIKNLFDYRNERNFKPLEEVNLISLYTDKGVVQHCDLDETTGNKASNADGYKLVYENDIVVNIILCWMGAIGRSAYFGVTSPAYDVYSPKQKTNSKFYHYLFRTNGFSGDCYKVGRGIMAMRWRTYSDQFRAIKVVSPPQSEQEEIVEYLDEKCEGIDDLIAKKQQYLTEIENYKKSLIYEYVTGKKEVHPL